MVSRSWSTRGCATALVVLLAACGAGGRTPTAQSPPAEGAGTLGTAAPLVSVQPVGPTSLTTTLSYAGNIQARATVNVLPQATGRINRLTVDVGSSVKAGDLIAELDHAPLDAQVAQAAGALGTAQARLDLLRAGARPEAVEAAGATLRGAEQQLGLMLDGGRPESVATAQANLEAARSRLANVLSGSTQAQIDTARARGRVRLRQRAEHKHGARPAPGGWRPDGRAPGRSDAGAGPGPTRRAAPPGARPGSGGPNGGRPGGGQPPGGAVPPRGAPRRRLHRRPGERPGRGGQRHRRAPGRAAEPGRAGERRRAGRPASRPLGPCSSPDADSLRPRVLRSAAAPGEPRR